MRTQKAITLIALVITIIVLLILAGVTINLVLGPEGLLKQAQDATDRYKQVENNEANSMSNILAQLEAINNGNSGTTGEQINITSISIDKGNIGVAMGGTATIVVKVEPENATNKNFKWTSSNEDIATVNNGVITAIKEGTTTITVETTDGSKISTTCEIKVSDNLATIAQPGDYIKYTVPTKFFTVTKEQTGYTEDQTFNTNDYTGLWQVLYNDSEHGLQVISAGDVTNNKLLYMGRGFMNSYTNGSGR